MKVTTVRARLALWNVGVLALALTGFGLAIHYFVRVNLDAQINRDLAEAVQPVNAGWLHPGPPPQGRFDHHDPPDGPFGGRGPGGPIGPPPRDDRHRWEPFGFHHFYNAHGRVTPPRLYDLLGHPIPPFTHDNPWDPRSIGLSGRGKRVVSTVKLDAAPMRVFSSPIRDHGRIVGIVQVARPLTDMYQLMAGLDRTLLMLIPLALAVAGLGGAFLTGRALRPVRRISQEAAQLGVADLSRRLPITGRDEFSELASNFNRMIGRLDDAFQKLESAYERQRQFTADASHELRTPLTAIKANTSLALWGERTPQEYRQALESADRAADTMTRIVGDLLLLARSDTGQLGHDLRPTPIIDVLERAVADSARGPQSTPIDLDLGDADLSVLGDAHSLSRLFVNLLENALRHTPPEGKITLAADGEEGRVVVKVVDTGEGIAAEDLPHLGERFYRVDPARSRAQGGAGLGLSICRSIVSAHGGELFIESIKGAGATVTVSLPRISPPVVPATGDEESQRLGRRDSDSEILA